MAASRTSVQLCGPLIVTLDGRRVERELPGRQARLVLGFLATRRGHPSRREELAELLWPGDPPAAHDAALRPLLSKLRRVLGEERLQGRAELRLVLPPDSRVDVERAAEAVHDAEAAIALGRFAHAWLPARIAWSVTSRTFMAGHEGEWVERWRRDLAALHVRALEAIAGTALALGPEELGAAERAGRALVRSAPFRESGYRVLMTVFERNANAGEALRVYDELRCLLRDELGVAPGAELQATHARLLGAAVRPPPPPA